MPWCHKCANEYRDGTEICHDCGRPLFSDPPENKAENFSNEQDMDRVHLTCTPTDMEAEMVMAKLKVAGIPSVKLYRAGGDYFKVYWGETRSGVDIYVPKEAIGDARAGLSAGNVVDEDVLEEAPDMQSRQEDGGYRTIGVLLLLVFLLMIMLGLFFKFGS